MLKNHLKIAWRNLKSNSLFSAINILGLSIGLAITILLFLFVSFERSFDTMYTAKNDIYRVLMNVVADETNPAEVWPNAPSALMPSLKQDMPDVKYAARLYSHNFGKTAFIKANEDNFTEEKLYWADAELLDIFEVTFLKGDPKTALQNPNTVALSRSTARKYFDDENPIGKTILLDNKNSLEVTGVFEDFPNNSTIDCKIMVAAVGSYFDKRPSWGNISVDTYIQLNSNMSVASAEERMQQVLDKNEKKQDQWYSFSLQPLPQVHLYSANYTEANTTRRGDIGQIKNLSFLALLILLIACVNYMNLMTARAQKRTKDVGINKTLGASTKNLIARFYAETGLLTLIALLFGALMAVFAVPVFNRIADQQLDASLVLNVNFGISIFLIWLVTTIIAGSYPAFYLSGFSPMAILNPSFKRSGTTLIIRKGLVVLQFAASVVLIIGVMVIYQQTQFMQNQKLGYNPENVIAISSAAVRSNENRTALINELKALPEVIDVSMAQGFPGIDVSGRSIKKSDDDPGATIRTNVADASITEVLQLELLAGRDLPKFKQAEDTLVEVLLNKKAIEYLGYSPEEAIGGNVNMQLGTNAYIIGVVDDFNFASLHVPIGPYAFHNSPRESKSFTLVRFNSGSLVSTMSKFKNVFKKVMPDIAFDYAFLDKSVERLYASERKATRIGLLFCILAIVVACLGLFGLAAFMAEQRKKEIGVRKVLGASVLNITRMLSKDFVQLVLVALVIAFPISLWLMENWLEAFAYRITIGWFVFAVAGALALLIALITVSFQGIRAALMNPVKSLRTE